MKNTPSRRVSFATLPALALVCLCPGNAAADQITFSGVISQSTQNGTGPAVNNPSLNLILTGDAYSVTINFPGVITAPSPVPLDLTGSMVTFVDTTVSVTESSFGLISLSVLANGANIDFSLLACLTTGSDCGVGNFLSANWRIPTADLNSTVPVIAVGLDQLHPLDLLEDDGITDIQGTIDSYSYQFANPIPEPSSLVLTGLAMLAGLGLRQSILRSEK